MKKMLLLGMILFFLPLMVKAESVEVTLKKCVDGDTARFIIDGKEKSTRFLAINTPEIKHGKNKAEAFGEEASEYTCEMLKNAKKIVLEYDENSDKVDRYDRVLAWVFVDDILLQEDLVGKGYAEVKYLYGDYKYTEQLKKLERKAKKKKLKIWSSGEKQQEEKEKILDKILDKIFKYIRNELKSML